MFEGAHVAIVTPFEKGADRLHKEHLTRMIDWHIESGLDGIVVSGTTGESPTLSIEEKKKLIDAAVEAVDNRAQVIAGTGTSSTSRTVTLTRYAREAGCQGALVVCPPYNKPTPEGLYNHYATIAEETGFPLIMYDNPGRSGASIPAETVIELADLEPVKAIKEASGDLTHAMKIREDCDLQLLSGSDALTYPLLSIGGDGVIAVVANVCPDEVSSMVHRYLDGDHLESRNIHEKLFPLMETLMSETNPIPVKCALEMMDRINGELRQPLGTASEKTVQRVKQELTRLDLL